MSFALQLVGTATLGWSLVVLMLYAIDAYHERQSRHSCAEHETLDCETAFLGWRCVLCGRRRALGVAWCIGTNRHARRTG